MRLPQTPAPGTSHPPSPCLRWDLRRQLFKFSPPVIKPYTAFDTIRASSNLYLTSLTYTHLCAVLPRSASIAGLAGQNRLHPLRTVVSPQIWSLVLCIGSRDSSSHHFWHFFPRFFPCIEYFFLFSFNPLTLLSPV